MKVLCFLLLIIAPAALRAGNVIEAGTATTWKYTAAAEPPATWRDAGFDDSKWRSGKAPLGFGETRLGTEVENKPVTAWFRREFDAPALKAGEQLVILLCVDDGSIVSLNGKEIGRFNIAKGPVTAETTALRSMGEEREGFYFRLRVPADALRAGGKNALAVEVHNAAESSDLFFDLALKTVPAEIAPQVTATAKEIVTVFNKQHFIGPDVKIPDGYLDGGRGMKLDDGGRAKSGREILAVDRARDTQLADDLTFARSAELNALPILDRVKKLAEWVTRANTPPGGERWVGGATEQLQLEFTSKAVLIGDWMDQSQAGVCRHRSLVFKLLADEAGLKAALVRGNYMRNGRSGAHAWNEVTLDDGRRVLVDTMHHGAKPHFPDVTTPEVVEHYVKVDNTPWYPAPAK